MRITPRTPDGVKHCHWTSARVGNSCTYLPPLAVYVLLPPPIPSTNKKKVRLAQWSARSLLKGVAAPSTL